MEKVTRPNDFLLQCAMIFHGRLITIWDRNEQDKSTQIRLEAWMQQKRTRNECVFEGWISSND
jgi:hypothetical protein